MSVFSDGVVIALRSGYELCCRWLEFWRVIQPWGWIYILLSALDVWVYPEGNTSRLMSFLWLLLYLGLSLIIWWNWLGYLNRRPYAVTWQEGWDNPDFRHFVSTMAFSILILPLVLILAVLLPVGLMIAVAGALAAPLANAIQSAGLMLMLGTILYCISRLIVLPTVLLSGKAPSLPVAWQLSKEGWQAPLSALAVLFITNVILFLLQAALFNLIQGAGVDRPSFWLLPVSLFIGLFSLGWLILAGQRLHDYLHRGTHARFVA